MKGWNERYLREWDEARAEVRKIYYEVKHTAGLQVAQASAVEEYKSPDEYSNMRNDLYLANMDYAVILLGPKNPNFDVSDLNEESDTPDGVPNKESDVVER